MSTITAKNLSVTIDKTPLLRGVDFAVGEGEWVSIIGPNGAGKSTLLRALAGVIRSTGDITIADNQLSDLTTRQIAQLIAWVPQSPTIPAGMTVLDYVLLGRTPHLHPLAAESPHDLNIAETVLKDLDLRSFASRSVESLSGGERQRTIIGRALAQESPILLLDEPTTALDLGHQQDALDLLTDLRTRSNRTIVSTMHDLTLAGSYADRLILLADGGVACEGAAVDVLTEQNISTYYRADVTVTQVGDAVLVAPRLRAANSTTKEP